MYLQEAFRALDALNEDTFSVSDDGISKLAEFQNNDDLTDEVKVIDPEAETEEDLQDSYVGKIILDCSVCHSKLYKDKEEIELNEDGTMANVGEECPYCYTSDGFKVIGEVASFGGESTDDEEVVENDDDAETLEEDLGVGAGIALGGAALGAGMIGASLLGEDDEDVNDQASQEQDVKESLTQGSTESTTTEKEEEDNSLTESYEDVDGIMGEKGTKWTDDQLKKYFEAEKDNDPVLKSYNGNADKWIQDTTKGMKKVNEAAFSGGVASNGSVDRYARPGGHTSKLTFDKLDGKKTKTVKAKDLKPGMVTDTGKITQVKDVGWHNGKPSVEVSYGGAGNGGSYAADVVEADRDYQVMDESTLIKESVNNVNVETDDSIVNVSADENGKVTVTTEPNTAADVEAGEEVIAPVSPETQSEIEMGSDEVSAEDEFVDMDVEEFDEESFDDLGESYLKKVYENVDSYKTTSIKENGNSIVVEGVINFKSGKAGKTSFLFEAKDCTKDGIVRFVGENAQLTKGKKSFTISGKVEDKKFIAESFNYNYRAKDKDGKSSRIYGTIKK